MRDSRGPLPRPREVTGYLEAAHAGRVPQVPAVPPRPPAGASAQRAFRVFLCRTVALVVGAVVLLQVAVGLGVPVLLVVPVLLLSALPLAAWWRVVGGQAFAELEQGYTTLALSHGNVLPGVPHAWGASEIGMPWDYRGVWVLTETGEVRSRPDRGADPPGWYPSPHRTGTEEHWTGAVWSGHHR